MKATFVLEETHMTREFSFETLQLHAGQAPDKEAKSRAVPIYQTTSYVFDNAQEGEDLFALRKPGNIYTRITNPTVAVLEDRIAALEGGVGALATASGMAAITYVVLGLAHAGDHVVAATTLYGGTFNLLKETLPRYGVTTTFVDVNNPEEVEAAIKDNTKLVLIESLGNPLINIPDFEKIADIAHSHKIPLVADNTFGTPYLINVISHGVDIVVHSATKFIGGHGTTIGGLIVDSGKFDWEASGKFPQLVDEDPSYHNISYTRDVGAAAFITALRTQLLRDTGAALAPFNAFLLLQGLETLSLRVERHVENTKNILDCHQVLTMTWHKNTSLKDQVLFSLSMLRADKMKLVQSLITLKSSQTLPTLPMQNHWLFTLQQQPINNWQKKICLPAVSLQIKFESLSVWKMQMI